MKHINECEKPKLTTHSEVEASIQRFSYNYQKKNLKESKCILIHNNFSFGSRFGDPCLCTSCVSSIKGH